MDWEDVIKQQHVVDEALKQAIATGDWTLWHSERKRHGEIIEAWAKAQNRDFLIREIFEMKSDA
ncbi:MAG: hypothetical protein IPG10_04405 [Flavobacteriales bacterium]|jgi:hypothetical protein|nr:hypothetical protein [Flavobacteriales bacterium]MBK6754510.1 hypothetical protein [Flavobacteriales bacterium]MBK7083202.1 hypothetical protein [Flavobacteriales bacterium]MBK9076270.1 hypothetical protein [Flavobacteriales bacterium]